MFFKDFVSVKRKKIKKGASQTYDTPSFHEERNNQNEPSLEEKKVTRILKKALKEIKK